MQQSGWAGMSQTAKASEPSMEEILASIRRIIADDEPPKPAPKPEPAPAAEEAPKSQDDIDALLAGFDEIEEPPPPAPPPPAPRQEKPAKAEPEILELSTADAVPEQFGIIKPIAQRADIDFMDTPAPAAAPSAPRMSVPEGPALLSAEANAAVGAAFGSLANTMFAGGTRTIDDLVKEMLRPMLKTWLDDNLPQLVERLVRAEIERVSRGSNR